VIGDVVGKGVAAALLMAGLQAHLRDQSATYSSRPYILRSFSAGTATWNGRQS
jgi:serine phosphatase RsbU (regulator of sigma subunit)